MKRSFKKGEKRKEKIKIVNEKQDGGWTGKREDEKRWKINKGKHVVKSSAEKKGYIS